MQDQINQLLTKSNYKIKEESIDDIMSEVRCFGKLKSLYDVDVTEYLKYRERFYSLPDNDKDTPLVETGHLDPKHLPEGHPDKTKICQHCDRLDLVVHEDMCYACIAGEQGVDW